MPLVLFRVCLVLHTDGLRFEVELGLGDLAVLHRQGEALCVAFELIRDGCALVDLFVELVAHHGEVNRSAGTAIVANEVVVVAVDAVSSLEIDVLYSALCLVYVKLNVRRGFLVTKVAAGAVGQDAVKIEVHLVFPLNRDAYRVLVGHASAFLCHLPLRQGAVLSGGVAVGRVAVGEVYAGLALELLFELLDGGLLRSAEVLHDVLAPRADAAPVLSQRVDFAVAGDDDLDAVELVAVDSGVGEREIDVEGDVVLDKHVASGVNAQDRIHRSDFTRDGCLKRCRCWRRGRLLCRGLLRRGLLRR